MSTIDDMLAERAKRDNDAAFTAAHAKIRTAVLEAGNPGSSYLSEEDEAKITALLQPWRALAITKRLEVLRRSLVEAAVAMTPEAG